MSFAVLLMPVTKYIELLSPHSNESLTLNLIFMPFGLSYGHSAGEGYLVGHLLDELGEAFDEDACVDVMDVAECAWNLGFESAGGFLESGSEFLAGLKNCPSQVTPVIPSLK